MRYFTFTLLVLFSSLLKTLAQNEVSIDGEPIIKHQLLDLEKQGLNKLAAIFELNPGDSIEGDYIKEMEFFDNGQKLLVSHFVSQNLSIIDWATQEVEANIPLGAGAVNMAIFDGMAVVSLPLIDSVALIDLQTESLIAKIEIPGEPNEIKIDKANNRALVASIDSQLCHVIDLNTNQVTHILDSFYSGIQTFSFITSNNRSDFEYYDFLISPDGSKAIAISSNGNGICVHDINSGNIDTTYNQISASFAMLMTESGKALILNNSITPILYQIDMNTLIVDSILLSGQSVFTLCRDMASDSSGNNVILSMSGGLVKADFTNSTFNQVTSNTAFWLSTSFDKQYAIGGGFYTQVVNISNASLVGTYTGLSQSKGALSDSAYHFVGVDPLRKEYLHSFDFSSGPVNLIGNIATGSPKEADASYRVAFSNNGDKILVANQLSRSASIIDADSMKTAQLVSGMSTGSFGCALTSDGKYGLIADYEGFAIHVIHMESGSIVASPSVGDRPSIIRIAPGDTLALVTNTRGNTVSFVRLDSANSTNIGNLSVGVIGVSWTNQGIFSDLQIPETGNFALLAASFDNEVKVIDMLQQSIVATIPTGDFPSQIAISDNGQFALVINKNENSISFLNVQGGFSSILNVVSTASNPTRVVYNSNTNEFAVCNSGSQSVQFFDGLTGNFLNSISFGPNYTPIQAEVLTNGKMAYLLASSGSNTTSVLRVDGIDFPLPARPCFMDASNYGNKIAIAMSGPDFIGIYECDSLTTGNLSILTSEDKVVLFPNPSDDFVKISFELEKSGKYSILNYDGEYLKSGNFKDVFDFEIPISDIPKGFYLIQIEDSIESKSYRFIKK